MRSLRLSLALSAALCLAAAGTAIAQVEEGDGPSGPTLPVLDDQTIATFAMAYDDVYRRGIPLPCGSEADTRRRTPEVACRVEVKVTIPAKVASFLRLPSNVLARGVATRKVDDFAPDRDSSSGETGRFYFLPLSSAVKSKLKAKRVGAIGVHLSGTISAVGHSEIHCESETANGTRTPPKRSRCSFDSGRKARIYGGQDGEMLCWRYMPWWLGTPATWGKMCPRPVTARV